MPSIKLGRRTLLAAVAAAVSTGAVVAATSSARVGPFRAGSTVHVIEHAITDTEEPSIKGKDAPGNLLVFHNPVYDETNTRQVGHDEGFCTRLDPGAGSWECLWTTFVEGGQLTVQGPYYDTRNSVLSITGGTGAYRGARGQMQLLSRNGGTEYDFVFQLG